MERAPLISRPLHDLDFGLSAHIRSFFLAAPPSLGPRPPVQVLDSDLSDSLSLRQLELALAMGWVDNATPDVEAQSEWRTIVTICIVLSALSIAVVSCRLWTRRQNHGLAADDWMAALSMVFALVYSLLCIVRMCFLRPDLIT